jgi:hypothetical protein
VTIRSTFAVVFEQRKRFVMAVMLLVVLAAIIVSAGDMLRHAGFDLRPKVLGARALLLGLDPYLPETFRWTAETPPALTDPEVLVYAGTGLSRVTYPPSLLLIYLPFAELPYAVQRPLWWAIEWAAMLGAIAALAASIREPRARLVFLTAAIIFFCGSWFWRWHLDRGQYYVFLVLLVGLDLMALRAFPRRPAWLGAPTGVAVAFRPTAAVMLPLLWLMGERRAAAVGAATAAVVLAATLPFAGTAEWQHYFGNAAAMARQVTGVGQEIFSVYLKAPEDASYLIEGYDFSPWRELPSDAMINLTASRACRLLNYPWLPLRPWCLPLSRALAVLIPTAAAGTMLWLRAARAPRDLLLLALVTTPVLLDYAVPMRWNYVDVMFLPMLAILVPAVLAHPSPLAAGLLVAALLSCLPVLEYRHVAVLRQALFLGAAGATAVAMLRAPRPRRAAPVPASIGSEGWPPT